MSQSVPSFILPGCPLCSHGNSEVRPVWYHARRTSEREGRRFVIWQGCEHAHSVRDSCPVAADSPTIPLTESEWAKKWETLFAQRTANYSAGRREAFRRQLLAQATLVGATESLDLSPETPAQPQSNNPAHQHG